MPIPIITQGVVEGLSSIPFAYTILRVAPWFLLLAALKYYFGGARNRSERLMHSKVVMVTGGTSGVGASVVYELATRGAQIILLTQHSPSDIFLVEYIEDLRKSTGNQLIYAEQVDLSSLYSVRKFATKWIDNTPPRRLDTIILCASIAVPPSGRRRVTIDGLDEEWQVNYLSNFHLLSLLSPALRAQPPDRDVRVVFTTCPSYIGAIFDLSQADSVTSAAERVPKIGRIKSESGKVKDLRPKKLPSLFGFSKLCLNIFSQSFQKHLNTYKRPDGQPPSARVLVVDPGLCRTPGMRRWLSMGSLWGLLLYLSTWPLWWLILKSPQQGAQSILYAVMEAKYGRGEGGWFVKECRQVDFARTEITNEEAGKKLSEFSQNLVEIKEKEDAIRRTMLRGKAEKSTTSTSSPVAKEQVPGSRRSRKVGGKR